MVFLDGMMRVQSLGAFDFPEMTEWPLGSSDAPSEVSGWTLDEKRDLKPGSKSWGEASEGSV